MTTKADVAEAEALSRDQMFAGRRYLKIAWAKVRPEDEDLIGQVRAAGTAKTYCDLLAKPAVSELFRRKVLYFGGAK